MEKKTNKTNDANEEAMCQVSMCEQISDQSQQSPDNTQHTQRGVPMSRDNSEGPK